jgi:catechol 2,3-dioxygenase-like lactoylglutathione lyase family enzyme
MASPLLQSLNLVVRDMDATLAFYRRLGLEIPESSVWRTESGAHHVDVRLPGGLGLDLDSSELAAHYNAGWRETGSAGGRCVIGFSVATREAVDERYGELIAAGYRGLQPPYDAFWGARYAIVEDPDGNPVGLMSPIDPARRGPPPAL